MYYTRMQKKNVYLRSEFSFALPWQLFTCAYMLKTYVLYEEHTAADICVMYQH